MKSDLGSTLCDDIGGLLADLSIGHWLKCCTSRCNEIVSFQFEHILHGEYVQCFN